jgi:hypothetical protein
LPERSTKPVSPGIHRRVTRRQPNAKQCEDADRLADAAGRIEAERGAGGLQRVADPRDEARATRRQQQEGGQQHGERLCDRRRRAREVLDQRTRIAIEPRVQVVREEAEAEREHSDRDHVDDRRAQSEQAADDEDRRHAGRGAGE